MKYTKEIFNKIFFPGILILSIGTILANISWGVPFFFHPDERNIASSVAQLKFPYNLNPNFFAYGSLPIYSIYFLGTIINLSTITFEQAIIVSRLFSALLTVLCFYLIYKVAFKVKGREEAIFATILSATSVGLIQFSTFGTFEIWISAFSLLMIYLLILFLKSKRLLFFVIASFFFGLLCSLKLSSVSLIAVPFSVIFLSILKTEKRRKHLEIFKLLFIFVVTAIASYFISSPFNIIDSKAFTSSMEYEGSVATGVLPVFYTGSFHNTLPLIFQYEKVLPFLINPLITILSIPAILYAIFIVIKKKDVYFAVVLLSFLCLFISGSILFVKWARYITPSLPFLYILVASFVFYFKKYLPKRVFWIIVTAIITINLVYSFSYIKTVRLNVDSRIQALEFSKKEIPPESTILSEAYDLGITPFNDSYKRISLYNFYELDSTPYKYAEILEMIKNVDYIIIPSQRVLKSRITNPNKFPQGSKFYTALLSQSLGFKKIYQTPCDIFCKLIYSADPIFGVEETVNVFDRPDVIIFQRMK